MKNNLHFQFFEEKGKLFGLCNNTKRIICIDHKLIYIKKKPVSKPTQNSEDEFEREYRILDKLWEIDEEMKSFNTDLEEKKRPIKKDIIIRFLLLYPKNFKKFLQSIDKDFESILEQKQLSGILKAYHHRQYIQHQHQLKVFKTMHRENVWTSLRLNEEGEIRED
jgi:hypothetical protein